MNTSLFFSVILPTYNRNDSLLACLSSLERQTYPLNMFEVIVVDDGSTDNTKQAVEEFTKHTKLHLKYVYQEHAGPGAARNYGVEQSTGNFLAFIEDDVVADEHWLQNASQEFLADKSAGVEGATLLEGSSDSVRVFERARQLSFIPCNFFLKKDVFITIGGYDPVFFDPETDLYFREDADLGYRLLERGYMITKAHNVIVRHPVQFASANDAIKHVRRFYFDAILYRKHPKLFRKLLEVKNIGFITMHRPFHYLCLFYILFFLLILIAIIAQHTLSLLGFVLLCLMTHIGIRYRYERSFIQKPWNVFDTIIYLVLPFYYIIWIIRGCKRFHSWGSLI